LCTEQDKTSPLFWRAFAVEVKMKADDAYVLHGQVDSTPTIVVNGKYRLGTESAGGATQVLQLVKYLVAKESH
jgi:thiol:disulfide interchange protein DsbA